MLDCFYELGIELLDIFHYAIVATIPLFIFVFPVCFIITFVKKFNTSLKDEGDNEC